MFLADPASIEFVPVVIIVQSSKYTLSAPAPITLLKSNFLSPRLNLPLNINLDVESKVTYGTTSVFVVISPSIIIVELLTKIDVITFV